MLTANAELVAAVLKDTARDPAGDGADSVTGAIAATRSLGLLVDDLLHALVQQARARGHTWAEIGEILHCSRQAAFQRFGGPSSGPAEHAGDGTAPIDRAAERALAVIDLVKGERWEALTEQLTGKLRERASTEMFKAQRARARRRFGDYLTMGTPVVAARHGYTFVDVPMGLERADLIAHVTFTADGLVDGLAFEARD